METTTKKTRKSNSLKLTQRQKFVLNYLISLTIQGSYKSPVLTGYYNSEINPLLTREEMSDLIDIRNIINEKL